MVFSNKITLLLVISCFLLSMYSQSVHGQGKLPGIRWGRSFQGHDVTRNEYKGKLWELMKRRFSQHQLNSK